MLAAFGVLCVAGGVGFRKIVAGVRDKRKRC
jgi:hypothetical protein